MISYCRILSNPKNLNAETSAVYLDVGYTLMAEDGCVWRVCRLFEDYYTGVTLNPAPDACGVWFKGWVREGEVEGDWTVVCHRVILRKHRWSDWSPAGGRTAPGLDNRFV